MRIQIVYTVPVFVTVDTDQRTIERAVVDDENTRFTSTAFTEDGETFTGATTIAAAHEIAKTGIWPRWEFGF